jgi:hypothetical protein
MRHTSERRARRGPMAQFHDALTTHLVRIAAQGALPQNEELPLELLRIRGVWRGLALHMYTPTHLEIGTLGAGSIVASVLRGGSASACPTTGVPRLGRASKSGRLHGPVDGPYYVVSSWCGVCVARADPADLAAHLQRAATPPRRRRPTSCASAGSRCCGRCARAPPPCA